MAKKKASKKKLKQILISYQYPRSERKHFVVHEQHLHAYCSYPGLQHHGEVPKGKKLKIKVVVE